MLGYNGSITLRCSPAQGSRILALSLAGLLVTLSAPATITFAQDQFPSGPMEMITHSGAGGGTDLTTRFVMQGAQPIFGVPMEVVNRVGGSGGLSMEYLRNQGPTGHTILTFTNTHINPLVQGDIDFAIEDMIPLARATDDPQIVFVADSSGHHALADLASTSEDRPLIWGVSNIGSIDHIAAHLTATEASINYTAVPYRGGTAVLTSLVGGDMEVAVANYAEAAPLLENGDIRAIAVLAAERMPTLPDIPTAIEQGVDVNVSTIRGFVALAGTPEEYLERLEEVLIEAMHTEEFQAFLINNGMSETSIVGREAWGAQIREMYEDSARVLQELGISN